MFHEQNFKRVFLKQQNAKLFSSSTQPFNCRALTRMSADRLSASVGDELRVVNVLRYFVRCKRVKACNRRRDTERDDIMISLKYISSLTHFQVPTPVHWFPMPWIASTKSIVVENDCTLERAIFCDPCWRVHENVVKLPRRKYFVLV